MSFYRTVLLTTALALSANAQANLITNGSFESGTFLPPSNATMTLSPGATSITGWTVINDSIAWIGIGDPWGLDAYSGDRFLDLSDYSAGLPFGGISQTIATAPGAQYTLSFYLGSSTYWGRPSALTASAGTTATTFTSPPTGTNNDWEFHSLTFTALAPTTTIAFVGASGVNYIGLDDVVVTGVPEPQAIFLMLGGLGVVVLRARIRRSQK